MVLGGFGWFWVVLGGFGWFRAFHTYFGMGGYQSPHWGGDLRGGQGSDGGGLRRDSRQDYRDKKN